MASNTLSARESIEAAFAAGTEKRLKTAEIVERVEANSKSKITKGTIRTQLQAQSKKGDGIKRVAPGTFSLVAQKEAKRASHKCAAGRLLGTRAVCSGAEVCANADGSVSFAREPGAPRTAVRIKP